MATTKTDSVSAAGPSTGNNEKPRGSNSWIWLTLLALLLLIGVTAHRTCLPATKAANDSLANSHYKYIHVNVESPSQASSDDLEEEEDGLHTHVELMRPGKGLSRIYAAMKSKVQELET